MNKVMGKNIIITLDYEISGNGSGDVRKLMIEPTERLIKILNSRKIKMTVFFEIEEFLTFQNYAEDLKKRLGYDPALLIEKQLKKIVHSGHEIGLHIHPQWIRSHFNGESFDVSMEDQCLFDVYKNENEMLSYLKDRADRLEDLVKRYDSSYTITSFRAGGLALRPEKITLNALSSIGIKSDSSVVKGLYRVGKGINIDYCKAPHDRGFWQVNDNVCNPRKNGKIIEFPIYSVFKHEYKKLTINRIKRKFFSSGTHLKTINQGISGMALPKTPWGILPYLFKKSPIKMDFCHMTSKEMLSYCFDNKNKANFPMTMIGHSKEFFNDKEFKIFLDIVTQNGLYEFNTIENICNRLKI